MSAPKLSVPGICLRLLEPLSVVALLVFLLWKSWMRWPDPLIDFPRELYGSWRMSLGELPYEQFSCWYGPLPLIVQAAVFRLLGPGLTVLAGLNIGVLAAALLLVRSILMIMGGRLTAWLGSVVFIVVFGVAHLVGIGNYNFITPYCSQATWGLVACFVTVWGLIHHARSGRSLWLAVAGAGLGGAFLTKPEPLLAAGGTLALYLSVQWLVILRRRDSTAKAGRLAAGPGWVLAGFALITGLTFAVLASIGGAGYGIRAVGQVLHSVFSGSPGKEHLSSPFILMGAGFDRPWPNLCRELAGGALLAAAVLVVWQAGRVWARASQAGRAGEGALLVALGTGLAAGWFTHWFEIGRAFPLVVLAGTAAAVIAALRGAWRGHAPDARVAGVAVFGTAALLMLFRMILNCRVYQYGFFMALLAALFVVHLLVHEMPRLGSREGRPNVMAQVVLAMLVLCGVVALGHRSQDFYRQKTDAVGEGSDRYYTFPRNVLPHGSMLNEIITAVRSHAPGARSMVVFPETAAANYLLRMPVAGVALEYHSWALEYLGRERLLADLVRTPPDVVAIFSRDLIEYGSPHFGADERSGREIWEWVLENYRCVHSAGEGFTGTPTGHAVDVYVRKRAAK